MSDGYLNFTVSKDRYREQIQENQKLQEESTFDSNKFLDQLSEEKDYITHFKGEGYRVNFDTVEELEQSEKILTSDEELVQYYEKTDPKMLEKLNNTSKANIVGKKSEKKKLRKKYLEAHSDEMMEQTIAEQQFKEVRAKQKAEGYIDGTTIEEIKAKMKEEDIAAIMTSYKLQNKSPKELKKIEKKISGLSYRRRQQLRNMTDKTILDADQAGVDTEIVRNAQDKYAKSQYPTATWESYRIQRDIKESDKNHPLPDNTNEKVKEAKARGLHVGTEYLERTARHFMKEVKYTEKNGKKVPASPEYEENQKYNQKFIDSLFSDNEDDWTFRFVEMEKLLENGWNEYTKHLKDILDGTFDLKTLDIDIMKLYEISNHYLCFSGLANERTSFFRSKHFLSLSKERQEELQEKCDIILALLRVLELKVADMGLDPTGYGFQSKEGTQVSSDRMLEPLKMMITDVYKDKINKYMK